MRDSWGLDIEPDEAVRSAEQAVDELVMEGDNQPSPERVLYEMARGPDGEAILMGPTNFGAAKAAKRVIGGSVMPGEEIPDSLYDNHPLQGNPCSVFDCQTWTETGRYKYCDEHEDESRDGIHRCLAVGCDELVQEGFDRDRAPKVCSSECHQAVTAELTGDNYGDNVGDNQ